MFASAIVGRDDVPRRLRRLLNVESGLVLPFALAWRLRVLTAEPRLQALGPLAAGGGG